MKAEERPFSQCLHQVRQMFWWIFNQGKISQSTKINAWVRGFPFVNTVYLWLLKFSVLSGLMSIMALGKFLHNLVLFYCSDNCFAEFNLMEEILSHTLNMMDYTCMSDMNTEKLYNSGKNFIPRKLFGLIVLWGMDLSLAMPQAQNVSVPTREDHYWWIIDWFRVQIRAVDWLFQCFGDLIISLL